MHARNIAAALLLLTFSLTACSGDKEPKASDSPAPSAAEIAYFDCLEKQGVAVVHTDSGVPREDKTKPWNEAAHTACAALNPAPKTPAPPTAEELAAARKQSECLRAEGVTWYPDPDPATGEIDQTKATPEQWAALKTQHTAALAKCRPAR
ncbi:hypothetical protein ABZ924_23095 [Streptomyces sp. NPDC046876]|uniref:hypothetical protein n=1 Tax=Streptomyces sp. NPDC046876 TaxID=3155616 RepID=UPI003409428D